MNRFEGFFKNDPGLKLLALGLAIISFLAIRGATSDEATLEVPVEVKVDKGVAVLAQDPLTVEVTLRGSQEDIDALDRDELKVVVHPKSSDPDQPEEILNIGPGDLAGTARLRVREIRPNRVSVAFDREASKMVSVSKPAVVGKPFRGKVEIEYEPMYVVIHGSHRGLKETEHVDTEPVDVDGRVQSFTKRLRVLQPGNTWVSRIEPPEVTAKVSIITRIADRVWTNVPVQALVFPGARATLQLMPDVVTVNVRGRAEVVETMSNAWVKVVVDCVNLQAGVTNRRQAETHLPPGLDVTATIVPDTIGIVVDGKGGTE
jgi:YbbR domain-containing protein